MEVLTVRLFTPSFPDLWGWLTTAWEWFITWNGPSPTPATI